MKELSELVAEVQKLQEKFDTKKNCKNATALTKAKQELLQHPENPQNPINVSKKAEISMIRNLANLYQTMFEIELLKNRTIGFEKYKYELQFDK